MLLDTRSSPSLANYRLTAAIVSFTSQLSKMGYEDSVYLAKLAEQAERYEGMPNCS